MPGDDLTKTSDPGRSKTSAKVGASDSIEITITPDVSAALGGELADDERD